MKDTLLAVVVGGIFLVLFLPLYVEDSFFFPFITGKNFAFRIIVELITAAWVLLALYDVRYRPQFSWVMATLAALIAVMTLTSLTGQDLHTSIWSNFERMDGLVTLVHVFLFTLVMGSVMRSDKLWLYFLNISLVVAFLVAIYGLGQQAGVFEGGRNRVDSKLGNAAYMAVYMLFHIFFAYLLILRSKVRWHQVGYGIVAVILAYTLLQTGTRGTFLGLIGGSVVAVGYVALFATRFPHLQRYAIGGFLLLLVVGVGFFAIRDTGTIPENSPVTRIANIDLGSDLDTRLVIWGMAWQGVEERPLLGWGLGNFNFVFNKYYEPVLFDKEQWFDRVHDIFLDWLIAGGVVGFVAYFAVMGAVVYYLFVVPVILRRETIFPVPEQAVLLGLLVAYLLHNVVVFDNIISYIFYAALLALIHSKIAKPIKSVESYRIDEKMIGQFVAPIVIVATGFTVYFVNVPGILAASDIIDAMTANTVRGRLEEFHSALSRHSFADQEIVEQLAQQAMEVARNQKVPEGERQMMVQRAELELLRMADEKPGDARIHNFIASFYRTIGANNKAREQAGIAASLSPRKPALKLEQALAELQAGNIKEGRAFAAEAFHLAEGNTLARIVYAAVLFRDQAGDDAKILIGDTYKAAFAANEYAVSSVESAKDFAYLAELYELRVANDPTNAQDRASLAFIYYQLKENDKAVATLNAAAKDIPSFASVAQCYAANIKTGKDPSTPCD